MLEYIFSNLNNVYSNKNQQYFDTIAHAAIFCYHCANVRTHVLCWNFLLFMAKHKITHRKTPKNEFLKCDIFPVTHSSGSVVEQQHKHLGPPPRRLKTSLAWFYVRECICLRFSFEVFFSLPPPFLSVPVHKTTAAFRSRRGCNVFEAGVIKIVPRLGIVILPHFPAKAFSGNPWRSVEIAETE